MHASVLLIFMAVVVVGTDASQVLRFKHRARSQCIISNRNILEQHEETTRENECLLKCYHNEHCASYDYNTANQTCLLLRNQDEVSQKTDKDNVCGIARNRSSVDVLCPLPLGGEPLCPDSDPTCITKDHESFLISGGNSLDMYKFNPETKEFTLLDTKALNYLYFPLTFYKDCLYLVQHNLFPQYSTNNLEVMENMGTLTGRLTTCGGWAKGKFYACYGSGFYSDTCHIYTFERDAQNQIVLSIDLLVTDMPYDLQFHTSCVINEDFMYSLGGFASNRLYRMNLTSGESVRLADIIECLNHWVSSAVWYNNQRQIILCGGQLNALITNRCFSYNVFTDEWTTFPNLKHASQYTRMVNWGPEKLLLFHGNNGLFSSLIEKYENGSWSEYSHRPIANEGISVVSTKNIR